MAGRKRKPDHLKVIQGTAQPCRMNPDAPDQQSAEPRPPAHLSRLECEYFGVLRERLGALGMASATYTETIALAASCLAEIEELEKIIAKHGRVQETTTHKGDPVLKHNPAVQQLKEARKALQSLLAELGLTPTSIGKVTGAKKKEQKNPFGALGNGS